MSCVFFKLPLDTGESNNLLYSNNVTLWDLSRFTCHN